jgi:hypothetical protein
VQCTAVEGASDGILRILGSRFSLIRLTDIIPEGDCLTWVAPWVDRSFGPQEFRINRPVFLVINDIMGVYGILNDKGMAMEYPIHREPINYSIDPNSGIERVTCSQKSLTNSSH